MKISLYLKTSFLNLHRGRGHKVEIFQALRKRLTSENACSQPFNPFDVENGRSYKGPQISIAFESEGAALANSSLASDIDREED